MRDEIVNSLTDVKLTTLENFAVVNSALEKVSVTENEITKSSQVRFYSSHFPFFYVVRNKTVKHSIPTYNLWQT